MGFYPRRFLSRIAWVCALKELLKRLSKRVGLYPSAQSVNAKLETFLEDWTYPVHKQLQTICEFDPSGIRQMSEEFDSNGPWYGIQSHLAKYGYQDKAGISGRNDLRRLYIICRLMIPRVVIETGVASGASTLTILSAMSINGCGHLYSIDLPMPVTEDGVSLPDSKKTGWLVPQYHELIDRWTLIEGDSRVELEKLTQLKNKVDVFYHDSLHTYDHMFWEFTQVWPLLRSGGFLLADDAHRSNIISVFADLAHCPYSIWKGFGMIRK